MKKILFILVTAWLLTGCNSEIKQENKRLHARLDSMESIIGANEYLTGLLEQIGVYMDSIDASRELIQLSLETGLSPDDYIGRMKNLNQYVQKAEWSIGELEKTRSSYASQVRRLKKEIDERDKEIGSLQIAVAQSQEENDALQSVLTLTENDLLNAQVNTADMEKQLALAKSQNQSLIEKVQLTQAESLYSQGESMEELAHHIQFAPRRKKKVQEDAFRLYSASLDMGYGPAKAKVEELRSKLKLD